MRWRVAAGDLAAVIAHLICPTGASRRENADLRVVVICEEHLRRSNPCFLYAARWIASLRSQ
jgi:hypothetical protein